MDGIVLLDPAIKTIINNKQKTMERVKRNKKSRKTSKQNTEEIAKGPT